MKACLQIMLLVAAAAANAAPAQETQPVAEGAASRQIQQALTLIKDAQASPEVRRIGAENLLGIGTPEALQRAVELLRNNTDGLPAAAVCQAISVVASRNPEALEQQLVPPLLDLLQSPDDHLRASAGAALASFPNGDVAEQLGQLASSDDAPLVQRLAAVDALAANLDRRTVVHQLILLLDSTVPDVRRRALGALRRASSDECGDDLECWRKWWDQKEALTETAWLRDRLANLRRENLAAREVLVRERAECADRVQTLSSRLVDELELVYRLTPQPQHDDLLQRWMQDPLEAYRAAAVDQIAADLADGRTPSAPVRDSLRNLLADESPVLRRRVLDVLAALTDPAEAQPVLARLEVETNPKVREAILRTLGRLQNPEAISPLTEALCQPGAPEACLIEAAVSLGLLAPGGNLEEEPVASAIAALNERLASTDDGSTRLKAALLGAMADIAAPAFAQQFRTYLDVEEPDLLLPALQGVRAVGDDSRIDRVLALTASNDARVRRRAVEALATLGGEPGHLEALVRRLHPAAEPNEAVRAAAWDGFLSIVSELPADAQLGWVERLKDLPKREEEFLIALVTDWANDQAPPPGLQAARRRLAHIFDSQGRFAESLPLWRDLWQAEREAKQASADKTGLAYLNALLKAERYERLDELVPELVNDPAGLPKTRVAQVLLDHLRFIREANDQARLTPLLDALDRISAAELGPEFKQAVSDARAQPSPESSASAPTES